MSKDKMYCTGCVYLPMCGKAKEIQLQQAKVSQMVKGVKNTGNITFCLDRVLSDETEAIKIFIGDKEIGEYVKALEQGV